MSRKQVSPLKDGSGSCDMAIEDDFLNNSISMHLNDDSFIGDQAVGFPQASSSNGSSGPFADTHVQPINRSHISSPSKGTVKPNTSPVETRDNEVSRTDRQPGDKWLQEIRRNEELEKERDWLRSINDILEKAADDLDSLPEKIQRVQQASETSHRLLDLYSSILTQTEHTRELLSDPTWEGLTEETRKRAEAKAEELRLARARELEAERQRLEEAQRRQEEEAESLRQSQASRGGARGRTAGSSVRGRSRIGRIKR